MQRVLIGTPVKNCAAFLPTFLAQLQATLYPRTHLAIAFVENDSEDESFAILERALPDLRAQFRRVHLERLPFHFRLPHTSRHLPEVQPKRLSILNRLRQHILDQYLSDNDYVFWLDADLERIPPDALCRLVSFAVDVVIPLYTLPDGVVYDLTSHKLIDGKEITLPALVERFPGAELIEIDQVNAAALVHRRVLEKYGYRAAGVALQEGVVLSERARAQGFRLWFAPQVVIHHADIPGTKSLRRSVTQAVRRLWHKLASRRLDSER